MAKKKEPSIEDSVALFKDIIKRASFDSFIRYNTILYSKNKKGYGSILIPEQKLWDELIKDKEFISMVRELDPSNIDDRALLEKLGPCNDINNENWITIDDEEMTSGKTIEISLPGFNYNIPINKGIFPIRFKKSESNNFAYKVYNNPFLLLSIKKKFDGFVEDSGITLIRIFQIL